MAALLGPAAGAAAALSAGLLGWSDGPMLAAGLAGGGALALIAMNAPLGRMRTILVALDDGVRSFRDGDYSLRLAVRRGDELGALVHIYNELGDALRAERRDIYQRELCSTRSCTACRWRPCW